ncbi:MAG: hypothetical protein ABIO92_00055 [Chloroflexia bacterium]
MPLPDSPKADIRRAVRPAEKKVRQIASLRATMIDLVAGLMRGRA